MSDRPTSDFNHLWNDLPFDERTRLMPFMLETQLLHVWQGKEKAIRAHKSHMRELDSLIKNLNSELNKLKGESDE